MKIIEALKKIKDLQRKADDIKTKISMYCSDLDCETPTYPDQRRQITEWLQAHGDIIKEISRLRFCIQKTNVMTPVTIELGNVHVTKTIAEWIHRRKDLAVSEMACWTRLDAKSKESEYRRQLTPNTPELVIKRRLYFDPAERDKKVELFRSEPSKIDATLEITNALTDLIES